MTTQATLPGFTGRQLRDLAITSQERRYHDWLHEARLVAARVAWSNGQVCADDVAHLPLPDGASPNVRGGLFNSPWFEFAGFVRSQRPEAHHNRINAYRLTAAGVAAMEVGR
jgi:hypothetical protein